ncbi:MAG: transglutaminase-like cysteine peptidase [Ideonella sp.]|nr:transglutaminase-like cysteine peptidase [Ideonella sp.]
MLCVLLPWQLVWAWDADRILAAAARHGEHALAGVRSLRQIVAPLQTQSEAQQINAINEFYNRRVLFKDDIDNWGQTDYWSSPLELLQRGAGDCEDYAIAKYFTLTAMGVPHKKLRLVYVRAVMGGPGGPTVAHMVLAYYPSPDAEPLVLDNLITEVRPAGRRPDLAPVFSFNAEGLWEGVSSVNVAGNPADRLSRWREVLRRAAAEGLY